MILNRLSTFLRRFGTCMFCLAAVPTFSATITWTNLSGGTWSTVTNWSPNQVPGAADAVLVPATFTNTIALNTDTALASLSLGGGRLNQNARLTMGEFNLVGGAITGPGTQVVSGTFNWTSGTLSGAGLTELPTLAVMNVSGSGNKDLVEHTLNTVGTVAWSGGDLRLGLGATINNSGVWDATGDGTLGYSGSGHAAVFNNDGWFRKSGGTFRTAIDVAFNNRGTMAALTGPLWLRGGGTNSGQCHAAAGTTIDHTLGEFGFERSTEFSGSGTIQFSSGAATFNGAFSAANLLFRGSTIRGDHSFIGTLVCQGGAFRDGATSIPAGSALVIGGSLELAHHTLNNLGTVNWTNGNVRTGFGTVIRNRGAWNVQVNGSLNNELGGASSAFDNGGVFLRSGAGGTLTIGSGAAGSQVVFTNSGAVESRSGTLAFGSDYLQTAGTTLLNGGNITAARLMQILGGRLAGVGSINGNVVNAGEVSAGLSPGLLAVTGNYTQTVSGNLHVELAGLTAGTGFDQLTVSGIASLAGLVTATFEGGFTPPANSTFQFLTCGSRLGAFGSVTYPFNAVGMQIDYGSGSAALRTANTPPSLDPLPDFVINEQAPFSFTVLASDADLPAQTLNYSLLNAPDGAKINSTNGVFVWTPTEAQGPGTYSIAVQVGDNGTPSLSATRNFQVQVREVNAAPQLLAIADRTVHAGTLVRITSSATDPDQPANILTYSLLKAPEGAAIGRLTGEFVWGPGDHQVGTHNVIIQVADNGTSSLTATLAFNVVVVSRPVLGPMTFSGGKPVLVWSAVSGTHYRVQHRSDVTSSIWNDLPGDIVASGSWATTTDTTANSAITRFYRIRVLP